MILQAVILSYLATVGFAQTRTTTPATTTSTTTVRPPADCSLEGVNVTSLAQGDFLIINQTLYDYQRSTVNVGPSDYLKIGSDVTDVIIKDNTYVYYNNWINGGVQLKVRPIIESNEISHPAEHYYINFTVGLQCRGTYFYMYAKIPLVETNTFTPTFTKSVYTYPLFSSLSTDLERLIELNPIIANDDDISNTEVIFSIERNNYFDLQYNGVVPNTLNKNHSAKLVPKYSTIDLTQGLELKIFVQDLGYPRKSSNATLRIIPTQEIPTFKRSFYIGDYYLNHTFSMRSQPELQATSGQYQSWALLSGAINGNNFGASMTSGEKVEVYKSYILPDLTIYKYGYLAYTLTVFYQGQNYLRTTGNATIIIELHHTT